ncbi:hypothetical protein LR61_13130 [Morganella morganii]|nr:hypothetical protein LR61_13130 [Morganella morganii]
MIKDRQRVFRMFAVQFNLHVDHGIKIKTVMSNPVAQIINIAINIIGIEGTDGVAEIKQIHAVQALQNIQGNIKIVA